MRRCRWQHEVAAQPPRTVGGGKNANEFFLQLEAEGLIDSRTGELLARYAAEHGTDELRADTEARHSQKWDIVAMAVLLLVVLGGATWWLHRRRWQQRISELTGQVERMAQAAAPADKEAPRHGETDGVSETDEADAAMSGGDRRFLTDVIAVVRDCMDEGSLSIDTVAERLNMSVSTFRRRLNAASGESPKAYVSAIQMQHAAELLRLHPDMRVEDVARRCAFNEAPNFTRAFRRAFGVTPSHYRDEA